MTIQCEKKYHNTKNLTMLQCEIMNNSKKERDNESLQQKIRQTTGSSAKRELAAIVMT